MRESIYSAEGIKGIMEKWEYKPNKALGQNFLIDKSAAQAIVEASGAHESFVLEIGPGLGALTFALNDTAKRLVAVEIDKNMSEILKSADFSSPETIEIVNRDFLKTDMETLFPNGEELTVVANLPYYATTPICMKLVREAFRIKRMTLMMQEEASERFFAKPCSKQYGPMTVLYEYIYETKRIMTLESGSYYPQPDVRSVVLHMERKDYDEAVAQKLYRLLKAGFMMRRKTLYNNLSSSGMDKDAVKAALNSAGLRENVRAESLGLSEFLKLAEALG